MIRFVAALAVTLVIFAGCREKEEPDAYGMVEAVEVIVGAETGGRIEALRAAEGDRLQAGQEVGSIETTQLALEREQLVAQSAAVSSRSNEVREQIDVLEVHRDIARRAYQRTRRLFDQRAATAQQLDAAERELRVAGQQIEAAQAQLQSIRREIEASEARQAQIGARIEKGKIVNPITGTVLVSYANAGEVTQAGQPLYRIANLDSVEVRAYITETQLSSVRIGQPARVTVDVAEDSRRAIAGTVTWIAREAEFTPTPIQTREERADLAYAVKIRVPNPAGQLKIGMPADVEFVEQVAAR